MVEKQNTRNQAAEPTAGDAEKERTQNVEKTKQLLAAFGFFEGGWRDGRRKA